MPATKRKPARQQPKPAAWVRMKSNEAVADGIWPVIDGLVVGPCACCDNPHTDAWCVDGLDDEVKAPRNVIYGGLRSDGHHFLFVKAGRGYAIGAGCRRFTSFAAARKHWRNTRGGTALGTESFKILDRIEREARKRGLLPARRTA